MSIEIDLKRFADSMERIANSMEIVAGVLDDSNVDAGGKSVAAAVPLPAAPAPTPAAAPAPTPAAAPAPTPAAAPAPAPAAAAPAAAPAAAAPAPAPAAAAPAPAPAPAPAAPVTAQMTLEELNKALVTEYHRLKKDRTLIDGIIKGFGVNTATDLKPCDYQAVLDKVKAL